MLIPAAQQGFYGMQTASQGMTRAATEIAQFGRTAPLNNAGPDTDTTAPNTTPGSLTEPLIDLKVNQTLFSASARVVETSDAMVGSLLDIFV